MKCFLALAIVLSSFSGLASEIIKLQDGSIARCESKVDVARHNFSSVYRPLEFKHDGSVAFVKVEFLRCLEDKNGKFSFKRDTEIGARNVTTALNTNRVYQVTRSKILVTVANGKGELADRQELTSIEDGIYSGHFSVIAKEYDDSPLGKKSLVMHVQSMRKIVDLDTAEVIDQGLEHLGAYRIIIK